MDPTYTKELTTPGEECLRRKLNTVTTLLCLAHGNAEVESSQSENIKVLTSERRLLSDDSINAIRLIKDLIRVTESGHAHKIPITPLLMQSRRSSYAVYGSRKARKEKDMQPNDKTMRIKIHRTLKKLESRK